MRKHKKLNLDLEIRRLTKAMVKGGNDNTPCTEDGVCNGENKDLYCCTGCSEWNPPKPVCEKKN